MIWILGMIAALGSIFMWALCSISSSEKEREDFEQLEYLQEWRREHPGDRK